MCGELAAYVRPRLRSVGTGQLAPHISTVALIVSRKTPVWEFRPRRVPFRLKDRPCSVPVAPVAGARSFAGSGYAADRSIPSLERPGTSLTIGTGGIPDTGAREINLWPTLISAPVLSFIARGDSPPKSRPPRAASGGGGRNPRSWV